MMKKLSKFIFSLSLSSVAFAAPPAVIKGDLDQDGLADFVKIVHKMPIGANVRRVLPDDGIADGSHKMHDYVQIETSKKLIYVMDFPFVESLEIASSVKDRDFKQCAKGNRGGFFAISEEGVALIFHNNGKFLYKYCFD